MSGGSAVWRVSECVVSVCTVGITSRRVSRMSTAEMAEQGGALSAQGASEPPGAGQSSDIFGSC